MESSQISESPTSQRCTFLLLLLAFNGDPSVRAAFDLQIDFSSASSLDQPQAPQLCLGICTYARGCAPDVRLKRARKLAEPIFHTAQQMFPSLPPAQTNFEGAGCKNSRWPFCCDCWCHWRRRAGVSQGQILSCLMMRNCRCRCRYSTLHIMPVVLCILLPVRCKQ